MTTDPISDMLTQIRNAARVSKPSILVPNSKLKVEITKVLIREGYLKEMTSKGRKNEKLLSIDIAYDSHGAKIHDLTRVSKPSRRIYIKANEIRPVRQGYGTAIISTPRGIMTDKEAFKEKVGGEVLFKIW
ncbi:MAG: 30S ribosomal protein S8 [bacterium]